MNNTSYVIDPEECMADNFSYVRIYGMDGPEGNGDPNSVTALKPLNENGQKKMAVQKRSIILSIVIAILITLFWSVNAGARSLLYAGGGLSRRLR